MSEIFNFTNKKLISIEPPKKGQSMYRDQKEKGLVLRVSYAGSKSFYLYKFFDGKPRLIKVGTFPSISIEEARMAVRDLKYKISRDEHKNVTIPKTKQLTFKELLDKYIKQHLEINSGNPEKTIKTTFIEVENAKVLYNKKLQSINTEDIIKIFDKVSSKAPIQANRVVGKLKAIFNWGIKNNYVFSNPVSNINKNKEKSKSRFLCAEELRRFFDAIEEENHQDASDHIIISLYTAIRKGAVISMEWENISFEDKTCKILIKSDETQLVPLVSPIIKILERRKQNNNSKYVFPSETSSSGHIEGIRKPWDRILNKSKLKDFTIHDLRRTLASWMVKNGTSSYIISQLLHHGKKSSDVTAVYARADIKTVREELTKVTNQFENIRNPNKRSDNQQIVSKENRIKELEEELKLLKNS